MPRRLATVLSRDDCDEILDIHCARRGWPSDGVRPEVFERRRARGPRYIARHYGVEGLTRIWLRLYRGVLGDLAWPLPGSPLTVEGVRSMRGNLQPLPKAV